MLCWTKKLSELDTKNLKSNLGSVYIPDCHTSSLKPLVELVSGKMAQSQPKFANHQNYLRNRLHEPSKLYK